MIIILINIYILLTIFKIFIFVYNIIHKIIHKDLLYLVISKISIRKQIFN